MDMKFQEAGNIAYGLMSRQQGPPEVRNLMVQLARLDDDLTPVRLEIEDQKARASTGGIIVTDKRKGSGNGQL